MTIDISLVPLEEILSLRDLYRQEMNCQIVHDSLHERGFTESYLIRVNGRVAAYGALVRDASRLEGRHQGVLCPARPPG